MGILISDTADIEKRIDDATDQLRFQHTLFSLILDEQWHRQTILRLLSNGLRNVTSLKTYRYQLAEAHAEHIFRLVLQNGGPKKSG